MSEVKEARLLVVDDETAQMQALCDTLQDHGYVVVGCTSGTAGLAALRQASFDLLLADLMMPEMDGIALLRSAIQIDPTLVTIIMTGAGTVQTAVQAMQSGALDYILKPFRLSAILPVLARALAVRKLRLDNAELERRVRERSAELEAANAELDAFTRSASHDLRTPLAAMIGMTQLLADRYGAQLPVQAGEWLGQIEKAGMQMNRLIDDLLRLSRSGRQALRLEPVDLSTLVRSCIEELDATQPSTCSHSVSDALPQVVADAWLLRQVFLNLLSNAHKFTRRKARPMVEVGSERNGQEHVIYVRDNGSGFDMAQADRLFGAFQRLHSADEFEGTGIGLSIAQRIVQRHGGRMWADATVGQGATFFLTLPSDGPDVADPIAQAF